MPHPHSPYQPVSVDCVKELFRLITSRAVRTELPLFAKEMHSLIGGVLLLTIGEPDGVEPLSFSGPEPELADVENLLTELQAVQEDGIPETFGAAEGEKAIDPVTLGILINLAVTLLKTWLERRRNGS